MKVIVLGNAALVPGILINCSVDFSNPGILVISQEAPVMINNINSEYLAQFREALISMTEAFKKRQELIVKIHSIAAEVMKAAKCISELQTKNIPAPSTINELRALLVIHRATEQIFCLVRLARPPPNLLHPL